MRAISTEISPETGAGGFILPNDRVDVILYQAREEPDAAAPEIVNSEIILSKVRVSRSTRRRRKRTARTPCRQTVT
jgi:pilus assembly protein CpaB